MPYDRAIVEVNRLHILQRFHNYVAQGGLDLEGSAEQRSNLRPLLERAYQDFVESDARSEKLFKVFRMGQSEHEVPLDSLMRGGA